MVPAALREIGKIQIRSAGEVSCQKGALLNRKGALLKGITKRSVVLEDVVVLVGLVLVVEGVTDGADAAGALEEAPVVGEVAAQAEVEGNGLSRLVLGPGARHAGVVGGLPARLQSAVPLQLGAAPSPPPTRPPSPDPRSRSFSPNLFPSHSLLHCSFTPPLPQSVEIQRRRVRTFHRSETTTMERIWKRHGTKNRREIASKHEMK